MIILDSAHGTYIPEIASERILNNVHPFDKLDTNKDELAEELLYCTKHRQDGELYYEHWDTILRDFEATDKDGTTYFLIDDMDLHLVTETEAKNLTLH